MVRLLRPRRARFGSRISLVSSDIRPLTSPRALSDQFTGLVTGSRARARALLPRPSSAFHAQRLPPPPRLELHPFASTFTWPQAGPAQYQSQGLAPREEPVSPTTQRDVDTETLEATKYDELTMSLGKCADESQQFFGSNGPRRTSQFFRKNGGGTPRHPHVRCGSAEQ